MTKWRRQHLALTAVGALLALYLLAPLLVLLTSTGRGFFAGLAHPLVWPALKLSLSTTLTSLAIVVSCGTPLAWVVARSSSRGARVLESLLQLPVVVPPAVAGVALLLTFGRRSLLSAAFSPDGWSPSFTSLAVVMAETFVSAPFFLQAAISAFRRLDGNLVTVARTLGASPLRIFFSIGVPLAAPGLIAGGATSWARALGEFGATLMFAGNLEGRTQTLPLAIYTALETDLKVAQSISVVLIVAALALLLLVRVVTKERTP
ncbi:MAG: ABC transporter permease [Myxococcaceae bacterium]